MNKTELIAAVAEKPVNYPADVLSRAEVTVLVDRITDIVNKALPKLLPKLILMESITHHYMILLQANFILRI